MKKNSIFHLFTATIFICLGTAASAQSLHSGYFLEGYTYAYSGGYPFSISGDIRSVPS